MATEKRQRQNANRQVKVEQQRKVAKQQSVKKKAMYLGSIGVIFFGGLFLVYLFGRGDGDAIDTAGTTPLTLGSTSDDSTPDDSTPDDSTPDDNTPDDNTTSTTAPGTDPAGLPSAVSAPAPGAEITGETPCPADDGSAERSTLFENAPPMCIDDAKAYTAEVTTNLGSFTIELDAAAAPETVNNFVVLARYHFYDGAAFHRIIPGFVIQGGDAVGDPLGTGDPGYSFDDELPTDDYEIGSLAMANSGPNTNGSQFFVITGEQGASLPASYSLFGKVTAGMDTVQAIEAVPTNSSDSPTEPVVIESVTITES